MELDNNQTYQLIKKSVSLLKKTLFNKTLANDYLTLLKAEAENKKAAYNHTAKPIKELLNTHKASLTVGNEGRLYVKHMKDFMTLDLLIWGAFEFPNVALMWSTVALEFEYNIKRTTVKHKAMRYLLRNTHCNYEEDNTID